MKNKNVSSAGGASNEEKAVWHYPKPGASLPPVYLEPAISGGAFFSSVDVEVDEIPVDVQKLGTNGWFYTAFNRTFCTDKQRLEKYGGPIPRVSTEFQRDKVNLANSPDMQEALKTLEFDTTLTSKPKLIRWNPDGLFPFDCQSNQASALSGVRNPNGFLPEGMDLLFRFNKRDPMTLGMENAAINDANYYSQTVATAAMLQEYKIEIKAMEITYQILTVPPRSRQQPKHSRDPRKKKKKHREKKSREEGEATDVEKPGRSVPAGDPQYRKFYYVDVPRVHFQSVPGGHQVTTSVVTVPAGSKFVAVTWVMSHQIFPSSVQKKNLAARFQFPPGAKHLTMEMDGKSVLLSKGLVNCGIGDDAHVSRTCADYHAMLVEKGLYSKSFANLFPAQGNRGYDGFLIVDLGNKVLKTSSELEIEVAYTTTSTEHYYLGSVCVSQYKFIYDEGCGIRPVLLV